MMTSVAKKRVLCDIPGCSMMLNLSFRLYIVHMYMYSFLISKLDYRFTNYFSTTTYIHNGTRIRKKINLGEKTKEDDAKCIYVKIISSKNQPRKLWEERKNWREIPLKKCKLPTQYFARHMCKCLQF